MSSFELRQFSRFISIGLVNTLIGLSVIYAVKWIFGLGDFLANALGYSVGLLISFSLNSHWTFAYQGPYLSAMFKFVLVALAAYGMNLLTVMIAIYYVELNSYFSQALGIPSYTLTSYLGSKYLVFHSKLKHSEL